MSRIWLFLFFLTALAGIGQPARANWDIDNVRVAAMQGDEITAAPAAGGYSTQFWVTSRTVVQVEIAGNLSQLRIGMPVRLVARGNVAAGAASIVTRRVRILDEALRDTANTDAGYFNNYIQGTIVSLGPSLQIRTPGGLIVTAILTNNCQVIAYRMGSLNDVLSGALLDVNLHKNPVGQANAMKIWVWEVAYN